jgi:hypothetical protein
MKTLLKDMTPIEYVGAAFIGFMLITFVITFTAFAWAVVTGDADLANASYGIAEGVR